MRNNNDPARYAIVRKPSKGSRYYGNFKVMYEDELEAFKQACRMAREHKRQFFVVEIIAKTTKTIKVTKEQTLASDEDAGLRTR